MFAQHWMDQSNVRKEILNVARGEKSFDIRRRNARDMVAHGHGLELFASNGEEVAYLEKVPCQKVWEEKRLEGETYTDMVCTEALPKDHDYHGPLLEVESDAPVWRQEHTHRYYLNYICGEGAVRTVELPDYEYDFHVDQHPYCSMDETVRNSHKAASWRVLWILERVIVVFNPSWDIHVVSKTSLEVSTLRLPKSASRDLLEMPTYFSTSAGLRFALLRLNPKRGACMDDVSILHAEP